MKHKLLLCIILLAYSLYAAAEEEPKSESIKTNEDIKYNRWSIAVGAGIGILDGDQAQTSFIPPGPVQLALDAEVEYTFTPIWGLNLQYNYIGLGGEIRTSIFNGASNELSLNASFNLLNLVSRCRKQQWNLYVNAGLGFAFYKSILSDANGVEQPQLSYPSESALTIPLGLAVEYNPHKNIGIFLKAEYRLYKTDVLDAMAKGIYEDNIGTLSLGIRYKITTKKRGSHTRNTPMCLYTMRDSPIVGQHEDRINALENKLDDLVDQFNNELVPTIEEIAAANKGATDEVDEISRQQRRAADKNTANQNTPEDSTLSASNATSQQPNVRTQARTRPQVEYVDENGKPISDDKIAIIINEILETKVPSVYYDINAYELTDYASDVVTDIANKMFNNASLKLQIVAYSDMIGNKEYNQKLSIKRANYIKNLLVKKYGIAEDRISIAANGAIKGAKDNYRPNRRCDFIFSK